MNDKEAKAALRLHEQKRQEVWSSPPELLQSPTNYFFEGASGMQVTPRKPGRQDAFINFNKRTFQSVSAARFIHEEMELFRQANEISRVPKIVRDRFWEIAASRYPEADEAIAWDHIRMNRKRPF
jgi:hypothetical protein